MHFIAYSEPYNQAHSVFVYFPANLGTHTVSTGTIAHVIRTTFLKTEIINNNKKLRRHEQFRLTNEARRTTFLAHGQQKKKVVRMSYLHFCGHC